jgi:UDP-glucose 4-epimerase
MKPQRILITGGAGFIGSHTADLLLSEGRSVVVLDNLFSGKLENMNLRHPNLEFIEGDVLEYPLIEDLLVDCDAVLHLAAIASVPFSVENPIYSMQVNTQGFLHVLQAIYKSGRPIRLVQASSAAVYGATTQLPCDDTAPLNGTLLSPYALQKAHIEDYATLYHQLFDVKSLSLRYFNVYGLRQDPQSPYSGVISRFLDAYKKEDTLTVFGDGSQSRDFIHVSDVARANVLALDADYVGALNVATGAPQTLLQLINHLEAAGNKTATLRFETPRSGDIAASYATTALAKQQMGFCYTVTLKEGIAKMLASPLTTD